jgi:hypothetical protein
MGKNNIVIDFDKMCNSLKMCGDSLNQEQSGLE